MNSYVFGFSEPRKASLLAEDVRQLSEVNIDGVGAALAGNVERESHRASLENAYYEFQTPKHKLLKENISLREDIDRTSMFEEIVGVSSPIRTALFELSRVAPTDATVLITGET